MNARSGPAARPGEDRPKPNLQRFGSPISQRSTSFDLVMIASGPEECYPGRRRRNVSAYPSARSFAGPITALSQRHAYNAHAHLYELPKNNLPVKHSSRWDRLADRAAASSQAPDQDANLQRKELQYEAT